jgi:hypothetical protein
MFAILHPPIIRDVEAHMSDLLSDLLFHMHSHTVEIHGKNVCIHELAYRSIEQSMEELLIIHARIMNLCDSNSK